MRANVSLELEEILLLIGLVIPGLLCTYLGIRTLRKDWLAMETWVMLTPIIFLFLFFFFFSDIVGLYHPVLGLLYAIMFVVGSIAIFYLAFLGQILVLRGSRDVVVRGIQGILDKLGLGYSLEGDTFDIPEIDMKIEINHFERSDLVAVRLPYYYYNTWRKTIHEEILNLFVGRPSERSHPSLLIMGTSLMVLGLVLGIVLYLD